MDMTAMVDFMSNLIYPLQAITAIYGMFLTILVFRRIGQKRFRTQASADEFLNQLSERLQARQFDGATELCDSPPYWSKAVPQLTLIALANRNKPIAKVRQLLGETSTVIRHRAPSAPRVMRRTAAARSKPRRLCAQQFPGRTLAPFAAPPR